MKNKYSLIAVCILVALFVAACKPAATPIPTPSPSPTSSPTATPTPTPTPIPPTETPTPTPTPRLPVSMGTPYPQPKAAISPQNAGQIVQLARWGKGTVEAVAWSPDGQLLAVASSLGIYLYDAETLAEVRLIETDAAVAIVAFSPDRTILASGLDDSTVRLWQVADGALLRTLEGHIY